MQDLLAQSTTDSGADKILYLTSYLMTLKVISCGR